MKSKVIYDAEAAMAFEYHIIKHQRDKLILFVNRKHPIKDVYLDC